MEIEIIACPICKKAIAMDAHNNPIELEAHIKKKVHKAIGAWKGLKTFDMMTMEEDILREILSP